MPAALDGPAGTTARRSRALPGVRPVRAQPPTTYQRFAPRIRTPHPTRIPRKAQSRSRSADWNASRKRRTRKTGDSRRRFSARRITPSTAVARSRGKNDAGEGPFASQAADGRAFLGRGAGAARSAEAGRPSDRIGNWESVASGGFLAAGGGSGGGSGGGAGGAGGGPSRTGRLVTPELCTAASAAAATTGGPPAATSSTLRKRSSAEISSGDAAWGAEGGSMDSPAPDGSSAAADGVRRAVLSTGPLGSSRRYSTTAAPSWSRSPLRRIVSFRIRRPATNVPFEEFRSFRSAVPFASVTSAWVLETDSWSTRTVHDRLRPSETSPSESSISRPSTTRT